MEENKQNQECDEFGNIWITSRTRMQSHARYKRYDLLSHIVLTSYSVLLLGFSVFSQHLNGSPIGPYITEISIVLSLSVLCASLVIWGLKFGKTADEHRECYLALQRLYEDHDARDDASSYLKILERYPNQSDFDYESMLFINVWNHGKVFLDRSGIVTFDRSRAWKFRFLRILRIFLAALVLTSPLIFFAVLYVAG